MQGQERRLSRRRSASRGMSKRRAGSGLCTGHLKRRRRRRRRCRDLRRSGIGLHRAVAAQARGACPRCHACPLFPTNMFGRRGPHRRSRGRGANWCSFARPRHGGHSTRAPPPTSDRNASAHARARAAPRVPLRPPMARNEQRTPRYGCTSPTSRRAARMYIVDLGASCADVWLPEAGVARKDQSLGPQQAAMSLGVVGVLQEIAQ